MHTQLHYSNIEFALAHGEAARLQTGNSKHVFLTTKCIRKKQQGVGTE